MAHTIEVAKTGRATCRSCRKAIGKGELRFGEETVNAFSSSGEMTFRWHHLACAASGLSALVRPALTAFTGDVPNRADIEGALQAAEEKDAGKPKGMPYAERAPTGRSKCMQCEQLIEKDALRVAVEREVMMGAVATKGTGYLHAGCAKQFTGDADLSAKIKVNSPALPAADAEQLAKDLGA